MATSSEKLARSIERLDRLKSEAAQLADIIASVLADGQPLLSLKSRPGDTYAMPRNATRQLLEAEAATLATKITDLQTKIDQAATAVE